MASSPSAPQGPRQGSGTEPNTAFRRLRGSLSPGEFAAAVRRAAREIGERVACDARYIGRVEAGEIRCPNYAYERVFRHMFPGLSLTDLGFAARETVRGRPGRQRETAADETLPPRPTPAAARAVEPSGAGRGRRRAPNVAAHTGGCDCPGCAPAGSGRTSGGDGRGSAGSAHTPGDGAGGGHGRSPEGGCRAGAGDGRGADGTTCPTCSEIDEESDVLRRTFITGTTGAALTATATATATAPAAATARTAPAPQSPLAPRVHRRVGEAEADAVEQAVHRIRLLDDRHGADGLYQRAGRTLRAAYTLLDSGTAHRGSVAGRLHGGAGELAISVGWLAHDSGRFEDARSHYAEALATARVAADPALEAHAFCNTAFLARDAGRPREAVRAAQAGQRAAAQLGSARLLSLLTLREAGGWAGLGNRAACEEALVRAHALFERGRSDADPAWMTFFGGAELAGLEAQCWSALHEWGRAAEHAREAVALQDPHFVRNTALFTAELAGDLAAQRRPEEAADAGSRALSLLGPVQSSRIRGMLETTAGRLAPYAAEPAVAEFLQRRRRCERPAHRRPGCPAAEPRPRTVWLPEQGTARA